MRSESNSKTTVLRQRILGFKDISFTLAIVCYATYRHLDRSDYTIDSSIFCIERDGSIELCRTNSREIAYRIFESLCKSAPL